MVVSCVLRTTDVILRVHFQQCSTVSVSLIHRLGRSKSFVRVIFGATFVFLSGILDEHPSSTVDNITAVIGANRTVPCCTMYHGWWCSTLDITLVFDQRTFPGLCHDVQLMCDLIRGKLSAVYQPTWPTQPFILLGSINE